MSFAQHFMLFLLMLLPALGRWPHAWACTDLELSPSDIHRPDHFLLCTTLAAQAVWAKVSPPVIRVRLRHLTAPLQVNTTLSMQLL